MIFKSKQEKITVNEDAYVLLPKDELQKLISAFGDLVRSRKN